MFVGFQRAIAYML